MATKISFGVNMLLHCHCTEYGRLKVFSYGYQYQVIELHVTEIIALCITPDKSGYQENIYFSTKICCGYSLEEPRFLRESKCF